MLDFVDLGCGVGGSIEWAKARFGGESCLGVDNRQKDFDRAKQKGLNVVFADVTDDDFKIPECRFVTMLHFLEHLKDEEQVKKVIKKSTESAKEFVFIKVPFFDKKEYLASLGFKLTWAEWSGHPVHVTLSMLQSITNELNFEARLGYLSAIEDSCSKEIIPLSSPPDVVSYEDVLGKKQFVKFDKVFRETYCFININCKDFKKITESRII